ncbi:MAG TPA: DUF456 domain-containing protein [Actinomycetota bacterium]|jgi:uncharacterized protein YqgC (DUF456 family)|nr:DUF456 domain-containing protein [Actinomycetota bacterium]
MTSAEIVLGLVMLVGLVGVVVPVFPGLVLVMGAGVLWAVDRGGTAAWAVAAIMAVIGVGGIVASTVWPARRASAAGAPAWVIAAGIAGLVIGFFAVPVVGALLGFPAGIFVAELLRHRHPGPAWAATWNALRGVGLGIAIQLVAGVAMIATWAAAVVTG